MSQIPVWINPLDELSPSDDPPTAEETLSFMFTPGVPSDPASVQARYREITAEQPQLFAPPHEERILNQLVWPLRHAKACYIVGNYLGTIALAGIVAEMTAILIYELIERTLNNKAMTPQDETRIFGRTFEELDQSRRIEVLKGYSALTLEVPMRLGGYAEREKKHLHFAKLLDVKELGRDARIMFKDAVLVVAAVIGQNVQEGGVVFTPQMLRYLDGAGKISRSTEPEQAEGGG